MKNIVKDQFTFNKGIELVFEFEAEENFELENACSAITEFVKSKEVKILNVKKWFEGEFEEEAADTYQISFDARFFLAEEEEENNFCTFQLSLYAPDFSEEGEAVATYELTYAQDISAEFVVNNFKKLYTVLELDLA